MIRGTGNMFLPASVISAGAFILIPLSPLLIFGLGPFPQLGIAGGADRGSHLLRRRLRDLRRPTSGPAAACCKPSLDSAALTWAPMREILRVGATSSIVSLSTNVTIAVATGLAGLIGPAAVAGYGTAVRLEYLLVPLVFGLGAPVAAMVGTSIGAGRNERALRVAWTGAAIAVRLDRSDRSCRRVVSQRMVVAVRRRREHARRPARSICASSVRSTAFSAAGSRSISPRRAPAASAGP